MRLKKNGAKLVNFVVDYVNGDMDRRAFELDYSGYVIECFPGFKKEHPRLSMRFADTIDVAYDACAWMPDDRFRNAIADALDEFMGKYEDADLF